MHLVRRCHFRSCDKDGDHTTGSAIPENLMIHANLMVVSAIEPELSAIEVYIDADRAVVNNNNDKQQHLECK